MKKTRKKNEKKVFYKKFPSGINTNLYRSEFFVYKIVKFSLFVTAYLSRIVS